MPATPAKLRDGSWGARVRGRVSSGEIVTITTKAGKSWKARVTRVLWSGDGVSLCATESLDGGPPRQRGWGGACITGGNCSSFGDGRSCGGYDCDGY